MKPASGTDHTYQRSVEAACDAGLFPCATVSNVDLENSGVEDDLLRIPPNPSLQ
jgi:hypothetical protein